MFDSRETNGSILQLHNARHHESTFNELMEKVISGRIFEIPPSFVSAAQESLVNEVVRFGWYRLHRISKIASTTKYVMLRYAYYSTR